MRQFFYPRAPLRRGTLLLCHLALQLGTVVAGLGWLIPRTPWITAASWADAWPSLAAGLAIMLLVMIVVRLIAELWLLPHHLAGMRPSFDASAVVTRSFERRPAVHDKEQAWTSQGQILTDDDSAVGTARVKRRAATLAERRQQEPGLNIDASTGSSSNDADSGPDGNDKPDDSSGPGRREPSL